MTEQEALTLAKHEGATHIQRLRNGFIAFRPSRVNDVADKAADTLAKLGKVGNWRGTLVGAGFKFSTRHFSCNGAGYYSSDGYDTHSWVLCREMHVDAEPV